jgi:hypothetical protein
VPPIVPGPFRILYSPVIYPHGRPHHAPRASRDRTPRHRGRARTEVAAGEATATTPSSCISATATLLPSFLQAPGPRSTRGYAWCAAAVEGSPTCRAPNRGFKPPRDNAIGNAAGELGTRAVTAGPRRATRAPCSPSSPVLCCCLLGGGKVPACQRERRRAWGRRQCAEVRRRWRAVTEHCRSGGRGPRLGAARAEDEDGGALSGRRDERMQRTTTHG